MRTPLLSRAILSLIAVFLLGGVHAQEGEEPAVPVEPDLTALRANSWAYFEGPRGEVEPRVNAFLEKLGPEIAELDAADQETAEALLGRLQANFEVYLELLDEPEPAMRELPPEQDAYTIQDLLDAGDLARGAAADSREAQREADRASGALAEIGRRRDAAFDVYVAAEAGGDRWLAGLRLVMARLAQEIAERRLQLLELRQVQAADFADGMARRVVTALGGLQTEVSDGDLEALQTRLDEVRQAVETAEEALQAAELAASGLDLDTPQGRSQRRLREQEVVRAEVELAMAEVALAQVQAERWWTELETGAEADLSMLEDQLLAWTDLQRRIEADQVDWEQETEREILAVQSRDRGELEKPARELLDQRLGRGPGDPDQDQSAR